MELLETLNRKIESAGELQSIVKTMKALAAVSLREYGKAVESLNEYNRTIELGLQIIMKNRTHWMEASRTLPIKHLGAVIFGSEQGMCGQFNEQIGHYFIDQLKYLKINNENCTVLAVGERVIAHLEEAGQPVEERIPIFGTINSITHIVHEILIKIEEWSLHKGIEHIVLFYNRPIGGASYHPYMLHLLPLDMDWLHNLEIKKWSSRTIPTFNMDMDQLFSSLIRQYLFISLYRAFIESQISENSGRLSAMQAAEQNIVEHLEELNAQFHHQRQTSITVELLDILTGFEALT